MEQLLNVFYFIFECNTDFEKGVLFGIFCFILIVLFLVFFVFLADFLYDLFSMRNEWLSKNAKMQKKKHT